MLLPNLARLPVASIGTCTNLDLAAKLSKEEKAELAAAAAVAAAESARAAKEDAKSTEPIENDTYYAAPNGSSDQGGAARGGRSLVLSQPLVDMLDYYSGMKDDGLLDALLKRKLGAALETCVGTGEANAKLAYLDIDTPPIVEGVTSDELKDTFVISIGITDVNVLLEQYLGDGWLASAADVITGATLANVRHVHACIPVHVYITCASEDGNTVDDNDEIKVRRLKIAPSTHLAPFVVFVNTGQSPANATQHVGTASHKLIEIVLDKLNPIMPLPNLPRKIEKRPWRKLYEGDAGRGNFAPFQITEQTFESEAVDKIFGLKALKKVEKDSSWGSWVIATALTTIRGRGKGQGN